MKALKHPQFTATATLLLGLFGLLSAEGHMKNDPTHNSMRGMMENAKRMPVKESSLMWKGWKATGDSHHGNITLTMGMVSIDETSGQLLQGIMLIDMNSIKVTDLKKESQRMKLESHLKNEDFFEVEKFPDAQFMIAMVTPLNEGMHPFTNPTTMDKNKKAKKKNDMDKKDSMSMKDATHVLSGWMVVKGHTKPMHVMAKVDMQDKTLRSISGKFLIDRTLFDVRYGSGKFFKNLGDKLIKDEFEIAFELQF